MANWKVWTIGTMLFLFPALASTVQYGSGLLFYILVLGGIILTPKHYGILSKEEKIIFLGFLSFFVISLLSMINTTEVSDGFKQLERYLNIPLAFFAYLFLRRYKLISKMSFVYSLYFASLFLFVISFYTTSVLNQPRAFLDYYPIIFGDCAVLICLLLVGFMITHREKSKIAHLVIPLIFVMLSIYAALASGTRGALLALPVVALFLLFLYRRNKSVKTLGAGFAVGIFALVLISLTIPSSPYERVIAAVDNLSGVYLEKDGAYNTSVGLRIAMWRDAVLIWAESPGIGTGIGDYKKDSLELIKNNVIEPHQIYNHAHSIYFDTLATMGLIGFIALIIVLFYLPFRYFYKHFILAGTEASFVSLAGLIIVVSFIVFGLTEGWLGRNAFVRMYVIYVVISLVLISSDKDNIVEPGKNS